MDFLDDWDTLMHSNLRAPFLLSQQLAGDLLPEATAQQRLAEKVKLTRSQMVAEREVAEARSRCWWVGWWVG